MVHIKECKLLYMHIIFSSVSFALLTEKNRIRRIGKGTITSSPELTLLDHFPQRVIGNLCFFYKIEETIEWETVEINENSVSLSPYTILSVTIFQCLLTASVKDLIIFLICII